jgi:citrate synthase
MERSLRPEWRRAPLVDSRVERGLIDSFQHDAHPMGILVGTVGALSTFYPDAKDILNVESRRLQILRLIAKMPTLAAPRSCRRSRPWSWRDFVGP